ncbi:type II secretion system protein GspL [Vibrio fujianensis]|uniref:type II secretion system protein GspL n=1 Tax=Vibrio fujianensis TaxID=1974215 RepID=UPI001562050A|nr:type II secretion system protein GspL [Vibrio fujianensis]
MSESLIVRLSSQQNAPILWFVWSSTQQEVLDHGTLKGWQQLDQLAPHALQRSTIVLLASSDLLLTQVTIPSGASRQFSSILPYLLEDELAQDVDELHFSVVDRQGEQAFVAVIERAWLQSILDQLASFGIVVKRVVPDVLTLPVNHDGLSALQLGSDWLIRKGNYHGISIEQDWLSWFCATEWVNGADQPLPLIAYTPLPDLPLAADQVWENALERPWMPLIAEQLFSHKINLLTGSFKPKSSWLKHWLIWRKTAISAVFLLVVLLVSQGLHLHQARLTAQAYRAESERIFRTIFPDKQRIPTVSYLKRQMSDELTALSGGSQAEVLLNWLNLLPESIGQMEGMEIQSLRFDANRAELRLDVSGPDFQSFEQARVKLAQYFVVEQGQLNKNAERVFGSFVLKAMAGRDE